MKLPIYTYGVLTVGEMSIEMMETQVYPTIFDRRHNVNLLGTYTFGSQTEVGKQVFVGIWGLAFHLL